MMGTTNNKRGFTIVELLIVIVVVGILATITVVAFNGVQGRAYDVAVQSDLRNLAMKILEQQAITGIVPPAVSPNITGITSFPVTRSAYDTSVHNLYYCRGEINGTLTFAVAGRSKSGNMFAYKADGGAGVYTGAWGFSSQICPGLGFTTTGNGYTHALAYNQNGTWYAWSQ